MSASANSFAASHFAAALLGCTALAGLPGAALAQAAGDGAQPAPASTPAPAPTSAPAPAPTPAPAGAVPAAPTVQPGAPVADQSQVIRTIAVAGMQRLEAETIVSYIQLREGQAYTAAAADQALRDLAATELFASQRIDFNAGNVVITVVENPVINRIVFEGNKRLKEDKILPEIRLAPRQIFTRSKVRADVERIIELYRRQGRFAATVEPQMVQLDQNRVDVVFEINEGPRSRVRAINIIGNESFSDRQLRSQMLTEVAGITKILSGGGTTYDPDRQAVDQQNLRAFYLQNGYIDFRVISATAELTQDRRDFILTYVVEEGQRYKFGEIKVESELRDFNSEFLTAAVPMKTGDWYDAKLVEDTIEQLTETAGTIGYAFAEVDPEPVRHPETLTMDLTLRINEAARVYVERIDVNGNTLTQDKVIRREFRVAEGDAFNSLQVRRSTQRINSLGFFQENFEIDQQEGSAPDRIVLEANVQEQPTGELSLSAGFSSLESFIFQGSIRDRNFRGRGQTIGFSANYSAYSQSGSISFSEPYVFDRNISASVDVYRRDYNNGYLDRASATYEQSTTGFGARLGVAISEYTSLIGRYTFNIDDITVDEDQFFSDLDGDGTRQCEPLLAGRYLCEAIGSRSSSILGLSLIYFNLDSRTRPTQGDSASLSLDFAGLGGSTRYAKISAEASKFWSLGSGFIFSLRGQAGYIKGLKDRGPGVDDVLLTDRIFLGEQQFRGFDIRGVGPRVVRQFYNQDEQGNFTLLPIDDDSTVDDALGGHAMYLASAELEIPLGSGARSLGLRPSIFADLGSVFDVTSPQLEDRCTPPTGCFFPARDPNGAALYSQVVTNADGTTTTTITTNALSPTGTANTAIGTGLPPFQERFLGNSASPRLTVGIGVDWNSPFGPFRINLAYPLLTQEGDRDKLFSFNVGTRF